MLGSNLIDARVLERKCSHVSDEVQTGRWSVVHGDVTVAALSLESQNEPSWSAGAEPSTSRVTATAHRWMRFERLDPALELA
jgi:hypothetical protein